MERMRRLGRVDGVYSTVAETAGPAAPSQVALGDPLIGATVDVTPSFDEFYVECRDRIGRALAVTLRDGEFAADAVDEAMVRAYQHWARVSHLDNPAGWVYRVGLNYARSRLRRRRGQEDLLHAARYDEDHVPEPAVMAALGALSVRQRAVVVCRIVLGWSEVETSAALGIRPGTAKSRLSRALSELQTQLHHLRPEDPR